MAVANSHPLADRKSVRLEQLSEELACGEKPSSCRQNVIQWARDLGFSRGSTSPVTTTRY